MKRAGVLRLALRAYPQQVRADVGGEMLDTALELSGGSVRALIGEALGLTLGGARSRARAVAKVGAARLITDGFCLAGVWWLVLMLAGEVVVLSTGSRVAPSMWWRSALLIVAFALALTGHDRPAGALGLIRMLLRSRWSGLELVIPAEAVLNILPVVFLAAMVWRPRERVFRFRGLRWLTAPVLVAPVTVPHRILPLHGAGAILMGSVAFAALLILAFDPRLAIACALIGAELGFVLQRYATEQAQHPIGIAMIAAAPLLLTLTALRARGATTARAP